MSSNKKYWKSVEELNENSSIVEALKQNEFAQEIPMDEFLGDKDSLDASSTTRRDFLKYVGFSTAAATLAACEGPVNKSIPYVVAPERITAGKADYYATTMADGFDFASVLVKTREGRPIKIENNKLAASLGGNNARVHASVLSMYDTKRLQGPKIDGADASWSELDSQLGDKLKNLGGKSIVLLTQTFASPSTSKLISEFSAAYPNVKHVTYDAIGEQAALDAFESKYGERALADYDFSEAEVIISVGADILGDWQGGGFGPTYAKSRVPKNGKMSRHVQFEANMTLSGANADKRVPMTPSQQKKAVAAIQSIVSGGSANTGLPAELDEAVKSAAAQLRKAGSKGVFVTGVQDANAQMVALSINETLGSTIIDVQAPKMTRQGNAEEVRQLVADMNSGAVGALLVAGVNPAYSLPNAEEFVAGLENVDVKVSFNMKEDETGLLCNYLAPAPHYLESWGDVEIKKGQICLTQPTIRPLFNTRQFQDSLLAWTDQEVTYYEYLKNNWSNASTSWNQALHDGFVAGSIPAAEETAEMSSATSNGAITLLSAVAALAQEEASTSGYELTLYSSTGIGNGEQANNPWLQEFPDPITRTSWDNYLTMSKVDADKLGIENEITSKGALNGNYVNITLDGKTIENVPVYVQPGQAPGSVGLALGYGKKAAVQEEMQVGVNAYPLYKDFSATQSVQIEKVGGVHEFACVQMQNTMAGRADDIIRETTLEIFNTKDVHAWNPVGEVDYNHSEISVRDKNADIWESFDDTMGPHFNLSIDLNACTGCGACVIACHSENNVPVVGKQEVRNFRDMHWLRIDRYYSSVDTFEEETKTLEELPAFDSYSVVEKQSYDNPEVAFQPVMCQHCNHAPCETVCPVAAIGHGRQGQNQMTYNRCVGTRYCANNCPYKVRRFNWFLYAENDEFDYNMNNDLGRMVLNPDVTVRSRGVMEKCSFCIQMTQKTILDAKREGRAVEDGEFATACSNACDNGAIKFGDVNMPDSEIVELKNDKRKYYLLEDIGVKPNVFYQVKVKNTAEA
ncbi:MULTISPECIES: TAT-variant-translocated molybdopterin oxidoreductase [Leeuwenhoekiella]|uniref:TAT-variant-translocated molybdopterin oxidoreductase n=2 Tax=Flavobacteriaceae TaxID=49546 RepID=UPI000C502233|nr:MULTISPECIES: TAT-variant-translocated molybdopterin oxidoreductase [Leeuwenhoekiella]MAO42421.1 quinol:cytochrome C oxidoreductase [Leeuwenhoekiella sp.]|tara:strand:+ start:37787 stop:40870 length:3084 start_codon:yes stop_codon:yes gene_type:complete